MEASNMQKMREAVVQALRKLQELCVASCEDEDLRDDCERLIRSALSAPPRQCDVGSAEEQQKRFLEFCKKTPCSECAYNMYDNRILCEFAWAQTPYEAQEGEVE